MAILKNGPLGNLSGKVGNVVIYTMNGKMVMRSLPTKKRAKATGKQKASQELFTQVMKPIRLAKDFVKFGFAGHKGHSPYHAALSINIKRMVDAGGFSFGQLLFSSGKLAGPLNPMFNLNGNLLQLSWEGSEPDKKSNLEDQVMIVVINVSRDLVEYKFYAGKRKASFAQIEIYGAQKGDQLEIYMTFLDQTSWIKDFHPVADSCYLGSAVF
jgi:hypothetical protein